MASIRGFMATSADGFIADAAEGIDWLEPFGQIDFGYSEFLAEIGTIVMGRKTYEQALGFGPEWVYAGKRCIVVTSRPLADPPSGVSAWSDGVERLVRHLRGLKDGDAWIAGGAQMQSAFIEAGALDRLELFVIPIFLGSGISLYRDGGRPIGLHLDGTQTYAKGVVRLDYRLQGSESDD